VLAPYSLVTYLTAAAELAAFLAAARALLREDGVLVLDAFVPRDVAGFDDFRLDYRRPHGEGELERHKRIAVQPDGCNRIERRYRRYDAVGALREEFTTCDTIRPYRSDALRQAAAAAGLRLRRETQDYGQAGAAEPRFATLELVRDAAG
jgi:hypothetical protein